MIVHEKGSKTKGKTFGATITVISNSGKIIKVEGSSWPNPKHLAPGIRKGLYEAVYSPTGHRGSKPGIRLRNGGRIMTIGPNPAQNDLQFADGINAHASWTDKWRGSANCITIKKSQAPDIWGILEPGETGWVWIVRE